MADEISGTEGRVFSGGVEIEAADWTADLDQAAVDRSSFKTRGEPLNAEGQRTGNITVSGPLSKATLLVDAGVIRGRVVSFRLTATTNVEVTVRARVTKVSYGSTKDNGPNWTINAAQYGAASLAGL